MFSNCESIIRQGRIHFVQLNIVKYLIIFLFILHRTFVSKNAIFGKKRNLTREQGATVRIYFRLR